MLHFARLHHVLHELPRRSRHVELRKARRKTCDAQYAHRVFTKCVGAMAQHASGYILRATKGVDDIGRAKASIRAHGGGGYRHGVDAQVAPRQVFFQGNRRVGVDGKAPVARRGFALGARKGVFLFAGGVQKHREVAPHGHKARIQHGLRAATDDHPIAIAHWQAHQGIAYCTTDEIGLHAACGAKRL